MSNKKIFYPKKYIIKRVADDLRTKEERDIDLQKMHHLKKIIQLLDRNNPRDKEYREKLIQELQLLRDENKNREMKLKVTHKKYPGVTTYVTYNEEKFTHFNNLIESYNYIKDRIQNKYYSYRSYQFRIDHNRLACNVHWQPNHFLEQVQDKWRDVFNYKKPGRQGNYIGIELEFCSHYDDGDIARELAAAGLTKYCYLKEDTSIEPDDHDDRGHELNILTKENEIDKILPRVLDVLDDMDSYINYSCGVHVHIDCRNRKEKKVFYNFQAFQNLLFKLVDASRKESSYCREEYKDWEDSEDRYVAINGPYAYSKFNTVEVRMHHGSLDYQTLKHWIALLLDIANYTERVSKDCVEELSWEGIKKNYLINMESYKYYKRRVG